MAQKVKGVGDTIRQINKFGHDAMRLAVAVTNQTAEAITNEAKVRSPVDLGALRQSIGHTTARLAYNRSIVYATAKYAPYQNWGTGGLVDVTPEFKELAMQFKGKGIKQINIPATGFLTIPYTNHAKQYPIQMQKLLNKLTRDFNNKK